MKKKRRKGIIALIVIVLLTAFAGFLYVKDDYPSKVSTADYQKGSGEVILTKTEQGIYLDGPGRDAALIFYPGAKVEYTAYLPLFYSLAEQGLDSFLVKMPCNLAILGQNKAETIMEKYDYNQWYLSGHSLGGAMAASFATGHQEELDGLVLLAAYPVKSLEQADFPVLSLYGSEDGVLNMEKLKEGREYMPKRYTELCIEGGNHAGFGNYGEQDGDRPAAISQSKQQDQTAAAILYMIKENKAQGAGNENTGL